MDQGVGAGHHGGKLVGIIDLAGDIDIAGIERPAFHRGAQETVTGDIEADLTLFLCPADRLDDGAKPLFRMVAAHRDQQRCVRAQAAGRQHFAPRREIAKAGREFAALHAERRGLDILQPEPGKALGQRRIGDDGGIVVAVKAVEIVPEKSEQPVDPFRSQQAAQEGLRINRDRVGMHEEDLDRFAGQRAASQPPRQGEEPSTRSGASRSRVRHTC
jgi:hypothetical protein